MKKIKKMLQFKKDNVALQNRILALKKPYPGPESSSVSNFDLLPRKNDFSTFIQKIRIILNQRTERKICRSGKMKKNIQPKNASVVQVG
jgi:hypothetical protein